MQRRPALPAVLLLIIGICLAFELPPCPWVLLGVAALSLFFTIVVRGRPLLASLLIAVALLAFGVAVGQGAYYRYRSDDISAFSSEQPALAQLELEIDEPPRLVSSTIGGRQLPPKQIVVASAIRVFTTSGWSNTAGDILVVITHPHPFLAAGQTVRVLGMLGRPTHATNPGEFDEADFYREQRVLTLIRISRTGNVQIVSDKGPGAIGWARAWVRDLLAMGFSNKQAADHAVLRALVLGDADPMMQESQQEFQKIGVAYLFSVSGMHIAVLLASIYTICRLLMRSPRSACWLCLAVVVCYGAVALPKQSALRAFVLCTAVLLGILYRRDIDKLQLLSIVAGLLLLLNPLELFDAGFQLGFPCIVGFILLAQPMLRWLVEWDNRGDVSIFQQPVSVRWRVWLVFRMWLVFSLVAWIVSLPIVAFYFGQLSLWVIPCGIVLFPIVSLALLGGCGKILLTFALPSLAQLSTHLAILPLHLMQHAVASLSHLPAAAVTVHQPSLALIAIYYTLLCLPLLSWRRLWMRRASICVAVASVCCFMASLVLGGMAAQPAATTDALSITFLDIGAGQCAVLEMPHSAPALIDAGSTSISDVLRSALGPFLKLHGDGTIGTVFLSHSDYDHISAISSVLPTFGLDAVYTSAYFAHFASVDPPAQALLDQLSRSYKSPRLIARGDHLQLTRDISIDVLWPPPNCAFNCNNTGLVLRVSCSGKTILFPADIQADAMRELLKSPAQLKADVLVAAHHGSSEVTTPAFVKAVDPQLIISSNGTPLTEKQKAFEQMIGQRPLYRTSRCGATTLHVEKNGSMHVETYLPAGVRH